MRCVMYRYVSLFATVLLAPIIFASCPLDIGCHIRENKLTCVGEFDEFSLPDADVLIVELCGLNRTVFHLDEVLRIFPNATNVTVTEGVVRRIKGRIPEESNVKVIRLNNLSMTEIDGEFFERANKLDVLDLRNNSLTHLHRRAVLHLHNVSNIYLSGNRWNCSSHLNWTLGFVETAVKDADSVKCFAGSLPGKPLMNIARFLHDMYKHCTTSCNCLLSNVVRDLNTKILQPIVEVNCSGRELYQLPEHLPEHTKILRLERNFINDLTPLLTNPLYRNVQDLYLDHNSVNSIEILEGSYWLSNFRVLSLLGNKLTELPTYAIDNALQQNPNMPNAVRLYLGHNPWRCDCHFTPTFQDDMLVKYEPQIRDIDDVKCSYVQGDENSFLPIIKLSRGSVCRLPNENSVRVLDLLNGVLATLIVLILGKLAYDYYYFKKTGRLPWIVTKMP